MSDSGGTPEKEATVNRSVSMLCVFRNIFFKIHGDIETATSDAASYPRAVAAQEGGSLQNQGGYCITLGILPRGVPVHLKGIKVGKADVGYIFYVTEIN